MILMTTAAVVLTACYCAVSMVNKVSQTTVASIKSIQPPHAALATVADSSQPVMAAVEHGPEIVWLLNYPQSRASYIQKVIQTVSGTTMASNYVKDSNPGEQTSAGPFKASAPFPFLIREDLKLPPTYMLTQTHCGGFAMHANTRHDVLYHRNGIESFSSECAVGVTPYGRMRLYSPEKIKKVVRLIRDPFDNVAHRFRYEAHKNRIARGKYDYDESPKGFKQWCNDFDSEVLHLILGPEHTRDGELVKLLQSVPCFGLFYQYILWHNNAADMIQTYKLDAMTIYLEDFRSVSGEENTASLRNLLSFLSLPEVRSPSSEFPLDEFAHYFTPKERATVRSFIKVLASESVWHSMKRYFPVLTPAEEKDVISGLVPLAKLATSTR